MFSHVYRLVFDNNYMNKIAIVGIIIVAVIGIGITASSISMENMKDKDVIIQLEEEAVLLVEEEVLLVEEEEPEETGRNLTVELSESIGLKTP